MFTDLVEAIDETSPMDLVVFGADQDWDDVSVFKALPVTGPIEFITSDGRRIYYVIGNILYAATASATTTADIEWSVAHNVEQIQFFSTDGAIVAMIGRDEMNVYNAVSGALITNYLGPWTFATEIDGLICDTDSNDFRVWFTTHEAVTGGLYEWTLGGGAIKRAPETGALSTTQSSVIIKTGTSIFTYIDKTNFGIVKTETLVSRGITWFFGRDEQLAYGGLQDGTNKYVFNGRLIEPLGVNTLEATLPAIWGDGRLFTNRYAIDERGVVEHVFPSFNTVPMAFSGQYLFTSGGSSAIRVKNIKMNKGDLWIRKSDGTDGNFDGRSESGLRLMTRVLW